MTVTIVTLQDLNEVPEYRLRRNNVENVLHACRNLGVSAREMYDLTNGHVPAEIRDAAGQPRHLQVIR